MLKEGKFALLNTNNLMRTSGLVKAEQIIEALQGDGGEIEISFNNDKKAEAILEDGKVLSQLQLEGKLISLEEEIKQMVKRLKGEK